jgi:hypothetical protein
VLSNKKSKALFGYFALPFSVFLLSNLVLFTERQYLRLDLLLFEQIIYTNLSVCALYLVFRKRLKNRLNLSIQDVIQLIVIGFLASCLIVPNTLLNVDRSRSFYVLAWVDAGKISLKNGEFVIRAESLEASDKAGVIQRIAEQQDRGLIQEDQMTLTAKGKFFLNLANFLSWVFNLENWKLNRR